MSRSLKIVVLCLLVLTCTSSLLAWASPVIVSDWTIKTPLGQVGIKKVGYDLGFGTPVQNVRTEVYLGPVQTTPRVAAGGAIALVMLVVLVFHSRRSKPE